MDLDNLAVSPDDELGLFCIKFLTQVDKPEHNRDKTRTDIDVSGTDHHGSDIHGRHMTPRPGLQWVRGVGSKVFPGTVNAAPDGAEPAYVCRAMQWARLTPGRFTPSTKKCQVPYNQAYYETRNYEISNMKPLFDLLTGTDYKWVKAHSTDSKYPQGILQTGKDRDSARTPIYTCRVTKDQDTEHPKIYIGAINTREDMFVGGCKYALDESSFEYASSYDVLVGEQVDEYEYESDPNLQWRSMRWPKPNPKLVPGAIKVGEYHNEPTYVCRTWHRGALHAGWYAPSRGVCEIGWGGAQQNSYFDLLTGKNYTWLHRPEDTYPEFDEEKYEIVDPWEEKGHMVCRVRHANEPDDSPYPHGYADQYTGSPCVYTRSNEYFRKYSFDVLMEVLSPDH